MQLINFYFHLAECEFLLLGFSKTGYSISVAIKSEHICESTFNWNVINISGFMNNIS